MKSTGALNDLERITKQAQSMVEFFGLSSLGKISYFDSTGRNDFSLEKAYSEKTSSEKAYSEKTSSEKAYSEKTSEMIYKEIKKIIKEQYKIKYFY